MQTFHQPFFSTSFSFLLIFNQRFLLYIHKLMFDQPYVNYKYQKFLTWSSVSNSTLFLPLALQPSFLFSSLVPNPVSYLLVMLFQKLRWEISFITFQWLLPTDIKSTPSSMPKTGVWQLTRKGPKSLNFNIEKEYTHKITQTFSLHQCILGIVNQYLTEKTSKQSWGRQKPTAPQ